ncbi:MAG: 6-pyruvoyl trahydropterin synthase family protein [Elusimicrobiota bacterium]
MYRVTRIIQFCYGHRLMDYDGKCSHPHGHNGRLEVVIKGKNLDRLGMVMDFEQIKSKLQTWVDERLDHKMILKANDPLVNVLKNMGEPLVVLSTNPTAENIARMVYDEARRQKLPIAAVRLWETPNSLAEYAE